MPNDIFQGFQAKTNVGFLKTEKDGYSFLQNTRGWVGLGSKRRGVQGFTSFNYGILGIFDAKIDGDANSPDKIFVWDANGTLTFFDPSELLAVFEFLFNTGVLLYLQSPDLNWWEVGVDATGIIHSNGVAAPGTTISSDLYVNNSSLFGFNDATGIWRLYVDSSTPGVHVITTKRYGPASSVSLYTTTQAFVTGVGPVFQDINGDNWRLTVSNGGATTLTGI